MDFTIPDDISKDLDRFTVFLKEELEPNISRWYKHGEIPRSFYKAMGARKWFGFEMADGLLKKGSSLEHAFLIENLAVISPGVAVAVLAHIDLGMVGLALFGSKNLQEKYALQTLEGERLLCLGTTESEAGSDVASIQMEARKVDGGWILNGVKAYVTGGAVGDMAIVTAVTDPDASRNDRISMFLVDLSSKGVWRKKLDKQVWIPSDLTRIQLKKVFVPDDHLVGERGRGLQQVLTIFTHSRVHISALTLGTTRGAFELALEHGKKRKMFEETILSFQAKAFEAADFFARMEASRLLLLKACWIMDRGDDFRLESSLAKYLAVKTAREVTAWAADLFGAASVMFGHPIHKFPMDAWAASLGEGTQDVQKLVIFRELMKKILP
jgi:alkylation response protein AidB-like acyl-CoA dehydrogenase